MNAYIIEYVISVSINYDSFVSWEILYETLKSLIRIKLNEFELFTFTE